MTVLIVDDHGPFRQYIRTVLEDGGFEVCGDVGDAETALDVARALAPDLVLLDVHLGDGPDGFDVARGLALLPHPPAVVVTSSRGESAFGDRIAKAGVAGFVPKDELSPAALRDLVQLDGGIRVALAEDSMLFREGMVRVLADLGFRVVAQAEDGQELLDCLEHTAVDVAVVDIRMPPTFTTEGLGTASTIGELHPQTGVMVLSQHLEPDYAIRILEDQPERRGYFLKDRVGDLDGFAEALRRIASGESVVDPDVVAMLMRQSGRGLDALTSREREVLAQMAEGLSNEGISNRLVLSTRTVETYVSRIFDKLGIDKGNEHNPRVAAVLRYLRDG